MEFDQLRQSYPEFVYKGFEFEQGPNTLKITYNFAISNLTEFHPHLVFPLEGKIDPRENEQLIFLLGMVEALSYWKATCSPQFIVRAGRLTINQIGFFQDLLINGLGEFFYKNHIDFRQPDFVKFDVNPDRNFIAGVPTEPFDGDLVLVGGGKESAVMLELLKKINTDKTVMYVNPTPAAQSLTKQAGIKNIIKVIRQIDPQLLKLNEQGFLNGHTPFSAYLSFLGVLVAQIYNLKNVIVGNEADANEGNLDYLGFNINHQFSKSFDYESKFNQLLRTLFIKQNYFSLLRPLSELQIAFLFSKHPAYHELFISCNRRHGLAWCGKCAKCINSYLILTPFLNRNQLLKIFGDDFLREENLVILKQIMELEGTKPFDCVASYETAKSAFVLMIKKHYSNKPLPAHLQEINNQLKKKNITIVTANKYLIDFWNKELALTGEYLGTVKHTHEQISV